MNECGISMGNRSEWRVWWMAFHNCASRSFGRTFSTDIFYSCTHMALWRQMRPFITCPTTYSHCIHISHRQTMAFFVRMYGASGIRWTGVHVYSSLRRVLCDTCSYTIRTLSQPNAVVWWHLINNYTIFRSAREKKNDSEIKWQWCIISCDVCIFNWSQRIHPCVYGVHRTLFGVFIPGLTPTLPVLLN